ncbi:MAG: response regulator [Rhodospirillales bacterium]
MTHPKTLIVVDDNEEMGAFVGDVAELAGFRVETLTAAQDLIKMTDDIHPDVIVLDIVMPDMDGIELIRELARRKVASKIIVMSGYNNDYLNSAESLAQCQGLDIVGSFTKPASLVDLENLFTNLNTSTAEAGHV